MEIEGETEYHQWEHNSWILTKLPQERFWEGSANPLHNAWIPIRGKSWLNMGIMSSSQSCPLDARLQMAKDMMLVLMESDLSFFKKNDTQAM